MRSKLYLKEKKKYLKSVYKLFILQLELDALHEILIKERKERAKEYPTLFGIEMPRRRWKRIPHIKTEADKSYDKIISSIHENSRDILDTISVYTNPNSLIGGIKKRQLTQDSIKSMWENKLNKLKSEAYYYSLPQPGDPDYVDDYIPGGDSIDVFELYGDPGYDPANGWE